MTGGTRLQKRQQPDGTIQEQVSIRVDGKHGENIQYLTFDLDEWLIWRSAFLANDPYAEVVEIETIVPQKANTIHTLEAT